MAEGIRRRHSKGCPARYANRCNCNAGWEASIYLAPGGRRITKTFSQKAEAQSWRAEVKRARDRGELRATPWDGRTLAEALRQFIAGMEAGSVRPKGRARYKPNTIRSYERVVRVYVDPSQVSGLKVPEIRRRDLQELADELLGSGLSASTVSNIFNPVQAFFRRAIDRDELTYNPSERIDLPSGNSKRPKRIASAEEAAALLAALHHEDRPIWATAFYAGLRRGELQALRACDIDFEANVIAVERGWDQVEGVIEPKSLAGRRTIPLLAILRDYLNGSLEGSGRSGQDLVFGRTTEEAFYASTIDHRAKRAWKLANERAEEDREGEGGELTRLKPITLHECRHTFASLLIDAGANPKAIQQFMGHSKIQTTFDVYGHLLPGSHDEVRQRMDAYLTAGA
ncbi:MAG: integrase [Solirubrobacterales bacterium]|jgi:integrase|nr:integrase [Solirubrobacterales bacterium]